MKLSKAQQAVMDDAKRDIDFARTTPYFDWIRSRFFSYSRDIDDSEVIEYIERDKKVFGFDYTAKRFEEAKNGIALVQCNSKTLYKLQEYGLIEIIEDSKGQTFGIDSIKVLNY